MPTLSPNSCLVPPAPVCFTFAPMNPAVDALLTAASPDVYRVRTKAPGPEGRLPISAEYLAERPNGDLFGLTQNVGMGWKPATERGAGTRGAT